MVHERLYQTIIDAVDMGYDITISHSPENHAYLIKVTERETYFRCEKCIAEAWLKRHEYPEEIFRELIIQNIAEIGIKKGEK